MIQPIPCGVPQGSILGPLIHEKPLNNKIIMRKLEKLLVCLRRQTNGAKIANLSH